MRVYTLFFLSIVIFTSCATMEIIKVNVQKPAQITLPASVQNVTIINNAATQPDTIGHTKKERLKQEETMSVSSDSINFILVEALAQFMNDEGFYNQVIPYDESLRSDNLFLLETAIDTSSIKKIIEETNADALISVDRFNTKSKLSQIWRYGLVFNTLEVKMQAKFRVYSTDGKLIGSPILFQDSIYWDSSNPDVVFPSSEEALKQAAIYTADKMVKAFIPFWQLQNRWYYTNNGSKMREASQRISKNDWRGAAVIWGDLFYNEKNDHEKAKLASNISLANEMLDDIENALTWANISYEFFEKYKDKNAINEENFMRIKAIKEELERRINEFEKLDIQKGIIEEDI